MTDAPLSPADEAAVQLIVNTIIGRARMEETEPTTKQLQDAWNGLLTLIRNQASAEIRFILIGARLKLETLAHERGLDLWRPHR